MNKSMIFLAVLACFTGLFAMEERRTKSMVQHTPFGEQKIDLYGALRTLKNPEVFPEDEIRRCRNLLGVSSFASQTEIEDAYNRRLEILLESCMQPGVQANAASTHQIKRNQPKRKQSKKKPSKAKNRPPWTWHTVSSGAPITRAYMAYNYLGNAITRNIYDAKGFSGLDDYTKIEQRSEQQAHNAAENEYKGITKKRLFQEPHDATQKSDHEQQAPQPKLARFEKEQEPTSADKNEELLAPHN